MTLLLRTSRLALRQFEHGDLDNLWSLYGDPEVMRHISLPTISRAELAGRVLPDLLAEFVGRFGLHPAVPTEDPLSLWEHGSPADTSTMSLGCRVRRSFWGRGYATEAAGALVDRAFGELDAGAVCATTMAVNAGSRTDWPTCP